MDLELKKADAEMIAPLHAILVACGENMYEQFQLSHWHPFLNLKTFRKMMSHQMLYGVYQNNIPVATFNVSTKPRDYYFPELWGHPHDKALYLGHLGIDPALQAKGVGKWCMAQVENIAREHHCKAVRFDALNIHPWLKTFYEKLGYTKREIVTPGEWDLVCFEKIIS